MEWKPITLPADSTAPQQSAATSWQASGNRGDYTLVALTSTDIDTKDASDPDAVIGYLISRGAFALPERVVRVNETGRRKWASAKEYRVPESELLATAKAFCEYFEVEHEFPMRKTWKAQAPLYLDIAAGKATPPIQEASLPFSAFPDLQTAPSMFAVFGDPVEEPLSVQGTRALVPSIPVYFPATPYTLVTDARADEESGHEFVLHFDPEQERYCVFFFADEEHANTVRDEYNEFSTTKWAVVVRFDPRGIEERFGVRYTDRSGNITDMSIQEYRSNMELKNEFRRED